MRRASKVALVAFVVALPLLMAPTGGLPSRPKFLSVGVNTTAPATGALTATGTVTAGNVTTAGTVTAANYVGNVGGVAPSDFARVSQGNTFTQEQRFSAAASATSALRVGTTSSTDLGYDLAAVRAGNARIGVRNHTDSVEGMMLAQAAAEGVVYGALTDHRVVIRQNNDDRIVIDNTGAIALNGTGVPQTNGEPVATVISARKAALTSRTSTTTSTADPDLTFTLPAGSWEVSGLLLFDAATTTTQGARYQLNFGGTFDPALLVRCIDIRTTLLVTSVTGINSMNADTTIPDVSTSNVDVAEMRCTMRATVGGTLQVRWAQEASSANATRLNNGSWLTAKRVGS